MTFRGGRIGLILGGLLVVGVVAAQGLEEWLSLLGECSCGSWSQFQVRAVTGWNAPSRMFLTVTDVGDSRAADLEEPETTVFTSGALKREADNILSKVSPGYDTTWGKQFVYDDPRFQAVITFVEASSNEIGVHLQISKADDYFFELGYLDVTAGTTDNQILYQMRDLVSQSNVGMPGEYVFILSTRDEILLYGPGSPTPYSNYHSVRTPRSPLQGFKQPKIAGVPLSYSGKFPGLRGIVQGEAGGAAYTHSASILVAGLLNEFEGPAPGYVSRSAGSADMAYIKSLTSAVDSSYVPTQALFAQLFELTGSFFGIEQFDIDLQLIYAVDRAGRPAVILNIGKRRNVDDNPGDWKITFRNVRSFSGSPNRGYRHTKEINLGQDFHRKSNVGIPGTWAFVVSEDFTDLLDNSAPVSIENPSLYKFCSEDKVEAVLEAGDITRSAFLDLRTLGWNGKWRKKSLGYLEAWDEGTELSHFRGQQLKKGGPALRNYSIKMYVGSVPNTEGVKMYLQRICVVGDASALQRIARDTTAAGLDGSLVPEKAVVFEYEVKKEALPGMPSFMIEQVVASFPGRETIAVISNFPPPSADRTEYTTIGYTECGAREVYLSNDRSNAEEEGRSVIILDSSENYGTIEPPGAYSDRFVQSGCDDYAGPCDGECPAGFLCQVHKSKSFCVNCKVFRRVDEGETSCCALDPATNQCNNALGGRLKKCFVEEPEGFQVIGGKDLVLPAPYPAAVCRNHRNFLQNGGACRLLDTFSINGNRKCWFPKGKFF